jgi:D-alanyl-D-alanine carboxypeptidase
VAHRLAADGVMSAQTFEPMRVALMLRRAFVTATAKGACPPPPDAAQLVPADLSEGYGRKPVSLRAGTLAAYRAMVAEARTQTPELAGDLELLTIFSGFRAPEADAAQCAAGGCGGPERANCSAHRTGLALDINVGSAPGQRPDSTDDANRRAMARSPAYLWLVANAARFGFVGYPFEPWHWEWTGEPVSAGEARRPWS